MSTDLTPVPNTTSLDVAALAIAWEIVRVYAMPQIGGLSSPAKLKAITNAVIESYAAIANQVPLKTES